MTAASKGSAVPPRQVCQLCGFDDDVTVSELTGDATWQYRCAGANRYHAEPHLWSVAYENPASSHEGICAELGLYDDLPACVLDGEGWVEHGIVEYRYKQAHPDTYRHLVDLYGHVAKAPRRFTASVVLAMTLGHLSREGVVAYRPGLPATGFWSYNGTVGYWAPTSKAAASDYTTWSVWAGEHGIDPDHWSLP